jgi:hypothetical protein
MRGIAPTGRRARTVLEETMRFKSKAQRRKFAELLVQGEITPEAYERWNRDTGRAELPERATRRRKRRKKAADRGASARTRTSGGKKHSGRRKKQSAPSRKRRGRKKSS